ncbi:DEAD-box type RNA helicase [Vermiconidia calcicola]|uniref:DEAD-box type RNA helicase n=1 Tax=Vermiconidia calcicola TaxID=1690605 RepID=A0ACC3NDE8_9PEZI|nr:DEAD-box type RNA helicase [Vermiconidia calcicola]
MTDFEDVLPFAAQAEAAAPAPPSRLPWKTSGSKKDVPAGPVDTSFGPTPAEAGSSKGKPKAPPHPALDLSNPYTALDAEMDLYVGGAGEAAEEQSRDPRTRFATVTAVPEELRGLEKEQLCYPDYADIDKEKKFPLGPIHSGANMYRGKDIPNIRIGPDGKSDDADRAETALLCIRNNEGVYAAKDFPNGDPRMIRLMIKPITQRPVIRITIVLDRNDKGDITKSVIWECNAQDIAIREGDINLLLATGDDPNVQTELPDDTRVQDLASKNHLGPTSLQLRAEGRTRPVWKGITPAEIDKLRANAESKEADDIITLTDAESCVVALHQANELSLYVDMPTRCQPALEKFFAFTRTAFFLTAHLGTFWYYRMACPNIDIHSAKHPFSSIPPPRWLVDKWRVEYHEDVAVDFEPVSWGKHPAVLGGIYGDHNTCAFELRLGTARESRVNDREFADLTANFQIKILGKFVANASHDMYLVDMELTGPKSDAGTLQLPTAGRRRLVGLDYHGKRMTFTGFITDDVLQSGARLTAHVKPTEAGYNLIPSDDKHYVSLALVEDVVANNRQANAISIIQLGQNRERGVYFPELAIGPPRPKSCKPVVLSKRFSGTTKASIDEEIKRHHLNEEQRKAIAMAFADNNGVSLLWGPPGTGKTTTMMALVAALTVAGLKGLACATNNEAVNKMYDDFARNPPPGLDELSYCRFTGAMSRVQTKGEVTFKDEETVKAGAMWSTGSRNWAEMTEEDIEDNRKAFNASAFELAMTVSGKQQSTRADSGFAAKKVKWITRLAASKTVAKDHEEGDKGFPPFLKQAALAPRDDAERESAKRYNVLLQEIRGGSLTGEQAKEARKEWRTLDDIFTRAYIERVLRVVFVTNSTACNEALEVYKPSILYQDEAGQSTPGDAMIPMAAFKDSSPRLSNECLDAMHAAIHTREIITETRRFMYVQLLEQFRMSPAIADFPNRKIYDGLLRNAASVIAESDVQKKVKERLAGLRPNIWNGSLRIGIDCSDSPSKLWKDTTSSYNEQEAKWIAKTVFYLLRADPKKEGSEPACKASDIVVVCPYAGQRKYLYDIFYHSAVCPEAKDIEVKSTPNAMGHQGKVVFISLTVNEPEDPHKIGFIWDPHQVTVNITRAMDAMFIVGNLKGWMRALRGAKTDQLLHSNKCELFRELIQDLHAKHDIIAHDDWDEAIAYGKLVQSSSYYADVKPSLPSLQSRRIRKPATSLTPGWRTPLRRSRSLRLQPKEKKRLSRRARSRRLAKAKGVVEAGVAAASEAPSVAAAEVAIGVVQAGLAAVAWAVVTRGTGRGRGGGRGGPSGSWRG